MTQKNQPSAKGGSAYGGEDFLAKIDQARQVGGVDLSVAEDLSLAVMNLISLEEHFFFTAMKTGQDEYLDLGAEIRDRRKDLMTKLLPQHEGETWCAAKHLLSSTMRLIEVGNKLQSEAKTVEALAMFKDAYQTYSIFWALKLKLTEVGTVVQTAKETNSIEDLVAKLANCCDE